MARALRTTIGHTLRTPRKRGCEYWWRTTPHLPRSAASSSAGSPGVVESSAAAANKRRTLGSSAGTDLRKAGGGEGGANPQAHALHARGRGSVEGHRVCTRSPGPDGFRTSWRAKRGRQEGQMGRRGPGPWKRSNIILVRHSARATRRAISHNEDKPTRGRGRMRQRVMRPYCELCGHRERVR